MIKCPFQWVQLWRGSKWCRCWIAWISHVHVSGIMTLVCTNKHCSHPPRTYTTDNDAKYSLDLAANAISVFSFLFMPFYLLLDFGVSTLEELAAECNFPWLLSNVIDNLTEEPLAQGIISKLVTWQGIKVSTGSPSGWATSCPSVWRLGIVQCPRQFLSTKLLSPPTLLVYPSNDTLP